MHVRRGRLAPGKAKLLALRGPRADEYGIEASVVEQLAQALDRMVEFEVDPHTEDLADLIVENGLWQPEGGNVGTHQPARLGGLLEEGYLVAQGEQVVRHRQRGAAGPDQGDAFAVLHLGNPGEAVLDVITVIR